MNIVHRPHLDHAFRQSATGNLTDQKINGVDAARRPADGATQRTGARAQDPHPIKPHL